METFSKGLNYITVILVLITILKLFPPSSLHLAGCSPRRVVATPPIKWGKNIQFGYFEYKQIHSNPINGGTTTLKWALIHSMSSSHCFIIGLYWVKKCFEISSCSTTALSTWCNNLHSLYYAIQLHPVDAVLCAVHPPDFNKISIWVCMIYFYFINFTSILFALLGF